MICAPLRLTCGRIAASGMLLLGLAFASSPSRAESPGPVHVILTPAAGGDSTTTSLAADGTFRASGLAPGRYHLALVSDRVLKTRHDTAKNAISNVRAVSAGGAAAGHGETASAQASGRRETGTPATAGDPPSAQATGKRTKAPAAPGGAGDADAAKQKTDGGTPNRISMNVTVGRATHALHLDGEPVEVEVGKDGVISGRADARPSRTPKGGGARPSSDGEATPPNQQTSPG